MNLPFDIARCSGVRDPLCATCRRKEPGSERQVYIAPAWTEQGCPNHIADANKLVDTKRCGVAV